MATSTRRKRSDPALTAFATSASSPFPDGYDLEGERKILAHLLQSDEPDPADPFYGRYQLFVERDEKFKQLQAEHGAREAANALVPVYEARQIKRIAPLEAESQDTMVLHTAHAMRLFLGVQNAPGESGSPSAGGKRVASALRALWSLSSNDNPYADWALIDITDRVAAARKFIDHEANRIQAKLEALKQKGLSYSVLQSREPAEVRLGFSSPYGFMIALLLVEVDFYCRIVKSAQHRDVASSHEAHESIQAVKHKCRSLFERAVYWQKYLTQETLIKLTRHDFLPGADELAQKRVLALKTLFGIVPKTIFMGEQQPRHTKRRLSLTDAEYRLLDAVPLADESTNSAPAATQLLQ